MDTSVAQGRALDDALDALAHRQRRRLLLALRESNPQDYGPTASQTDGGDDEDDGLDVLVEMHHVHLPKLEDYGFIEWDREADEVRKGPRFETVDPLLELLDDHREELPSNWR
jgi:hypothetical protein